MNRSTQSISRWLILAAILVGFGLHTYDLGAASGNYQARRHACGTDRNENGCGVSSRVPRSAPLIWHSLWGRP